MMPKSYLYKVHVLLGYSPRRIAKLHKEMLGVYVSPWAVRGYLKKYGIYIRPPKKAEKKKRKQRYRGPAHGAKYLRERVRKGLGVKKFLDSFNDYWRAGILNKFFRSMSKKKLKDSEERILRFIVRTYPYIGPSVIDLVLPKRKVVINWPLVEEVRKSLGVSVYEFCKKTKLDRCNYTLIKNRRQSAVGLRSTVLRIFEAYREMPILKISKEIMYDTE